MDAEERFQINQMFWYLVLGAFPPHDRPDSFTAMHEEFGELDALERGN